MRPTGESSSRRISASTAWKSALTSAPKRSLSRPSRAGVATQPVLLRDHAILDLYGSAGRDALKLRHGELVADIRDARGRDLFVELAEHFARDRMDDGNAVAAEAQQRPRTHAVGGGEVDGDARRVDVEDEAMLDGHRRARGRRRRDRARGGRA